MDNFDKKSTTSSFYGRKSSELLQQHRPETPSSFYGQDRGSRAGHSIAPSHVPDSAGYGARDSFFSASGQPRSTAREDEEMLAGTIEETWDVYADFNNAGPKYSSAFGQSSNGYHPISPTPNKEGARSATGPVEMVTVPALGPEWQKSEMRGMTKSGRREAKAEVRKAKWSAFRRGESGLCGIKWLNRRFLVFLLFGLIIIVVIVLAVTMPRVPSFAFSNDAPLIQATGDWEHAIPVLFSRFPANFSFPAFANLQVNTQDNYLPIHFNHLHAKVYDLDTTRQVADGDLAGYSVPAKAFPIVHLPLNFTYISTNDSDQTWKNWYNSCRNKGNYPSGKRPAVKFRLLLEMSIRGLPGTRTTATQISDAECPIELPINSV